MDEHASHAMLTTIMTAISVGLLLIVVARKINLSAIVLLLLGGIVLGPEVLGIVQPETLGQGLRVLVSLAVGLILFEGGLSLDLKGYLSASKLIRRLLSVGVLVTWLTTALGIWTLFRFPPSFCLLSASLVIVTGPTVIAPLLKRIKVQLNLHNILNWEAVLIDPIGVFIAVLCYEWIGGQSGDIVLTNFAMRVLTGLAVGLVGGMAIYWLIRKKFVPEDLTNSFALACAVLIYGVTEAIGQRLNFNEAGLLSMVIAGFVVGVMRPVELKQIRQFKAEITDLMIGMLFILLTARLEFAQFRTFGLEGALAVALVIFAVRPLNVFLSSWGLDLSWRERVFLSWVAPRGIVAASMASLFALSLERTQFAGDATFIETFTYSVIIGTILLQGFTAGPLAQVLGLRRPAPKGWLIVGAHAFGRKLARFVAARGDVQVVLADMNPKLIADARAEALVAIHADARDLVGEDRPELQEVGNLLALTDNEDLNALLCQRWLEVLGRDHVFRWQSPRNGSTRKSTEDPEEMPGQVVWPHLPKPSLLANELMRGEANTVEMGHPALDPGNLTTPLVALRNHHMVLDPAEMPDFPEGSWGQTLYIRRAAEYLVRSLRPELIVRLEVTEPRRVFEALIDKVVALVPSVPRDATVAELLEREQLFPTALGHEVAVPHAYVSALQSRMCVIAQVPAGVEFQAPDGLPVRLMFLLLSPPGDPEGHLATLAEIARLSSETRTRDAMVNAEHPADLLSIVHAFDPSKAERTSNAHESVRATL